MAADPTFHCNVLEMLAPLEGVTSRPMFGGYGIFAFNDISADGLGEGGLAGGWIPFDEFVAHLFRPAS